MGVEGPAERAIFFDPAGHGERCSYVLTGGGATTVDGVFSHDLEPVRVGGALDLRGELLTFTCDLAALPDGARGDVSDQLIWHALIYAVRAIERDVTGIARLTLGEQP